MAPESGRPGATHAEPDTARTDTDQGALSVVDCTAIAATPVASDATRRRDRVLLLLGTLTSTTEKVAALLGEAQASDDHTALGYRSWTDYIAGEYRSALAGLSTAVRRPAVAALAEGGLSSRAIAEIAGVGQSTVARDLQVTRSGSPDTGREFFDTDAEMRNSMVMADAGDGEFEAALTAARAQDDLSQENVIANLPAKRITGRDGKSYPEQAAPRPARRRPLPDAFTDAMYKLGGVCTTLGNLHGDDRFADNVDRLRPHRHRLQEHADLLRLILTDLDGGAER